MKSLRVAFSEWYIYIVFAIWYGTEILFNTTIKQVNGISIDVLNSIMAWVILGMLVFQIVVLQRYDLKEVFLFGPVSLLIAYTTIQANHKLLISMWLFVVASKYADFERMVKLAHKLLMIILPIVFILFYYEIIDERTLKRGSMIRHSLGFSHPNQLGLRVFQFVLCSLYIRRSRLNGLDYILTILAACFLYLVPNSQSSFLATLILIIDIIVYKITWDKDRIKDFISNLMIIISVLVNFFSVVLSLFNVKKVPVLSQLDRILSYRFSQCHRTYSYYGIRLFGNDIQSFVSKPVIGKYLHFWLDNAYMTLLLRYGILVFLTFSVVYTVTMIKLKKTDNYFMLLVFTLFSVYGIMENNFFSLSHNMFLIMISGVIFNKEIRERQHPQKHYIIKFAN